MLSHPDGARGGPHGLRRFFGGQSHDDTQDHDLTLFIGKDTQELRHALVQLALESALLGADVTLDLVGDLGDRFGTVTGRGAMRVGHLVLGDPVDEGQERAALITVRRQCREHRETHLLSNVVCGSERTLLPANPSAAVPHYQRTDGRQQPLDRLRITLNSSGDRLIQSVPHIGHRRQQSQCYV